MQANQEEAGMINACVRGLIQANANAILVLTAALHVFIFTISTVFSCVADIGIVNATAITTVHHWSKAIWKQLNDYPVESAQLIFGTSCSCPVCQDRVKLLHRYSLLLTAMQFILSIGAIPSCVTDLFIWDTRAIIALHRRSQTSC